MITGERENGLKVCTLSPFERESANSFEDRLVTRSGGRISPLKRPAVLNSIPELRAPKLREEVQFVVNNKGQAGVETILVRDDSASFMDESSSDEDPIDIPSRESSFNLPPARAPKIGRFETAETRRHSMSASVYSQSESSRSSQRSVRQGSHDSEAETVVEDEDRGDATRELAKLMQRRKRDQPTTKSTSHRRPATGYGHNEYFTDASTSNSPTAITDSDNVTPNGMRGGSTRCVCKNPEGRGFMIQWYVFGEGVRILSY